jgi:hypothetical protein
LLTDTANTWHCECVAMVVKKIRKLHFHVDMPSLTERNVCLEFHLF